MRHEFARIRRETDPLTNSLDFGLQRMHFRRGRNPGPDGMRFLGAEGTHTGEIKLELRPLDPIQPIDNLIGGPSVDVTDKTQGYVIILHIDPPGSRQTTAQQ